MTISISSVLLTVISVATDRNPNTDMQNNKEHIYQKFQMTNLALGSSNVTLNLLLWNFLPQSFICWLFTQVNFPHHSKKLQQSKASRLSTGPSVWPDGMTLFLSKYWSADPSLTRPTSVSCGLLKQFFKFNIQAWIRCLSQKQLLWTGDRLKLSWWS